MGLKCRREGSNDAEILPQTRWQGSSFIFYRVIRDSCVTRVIRVVRATRVTWGSRVMRVSRVIIDVRSVR